MSIRKGWLERKKKLGNNLEAEEAMGEVVDEQVETGGAVDMAKLPAASRKNTSTNPVPINRIAKMEECTGHLRSKVCGYLKALGQISRNRQHLRLTLS